MKMILKATIGIIAISIMSISAVLARDNNHAREYDRPHQERHYRHNERRQHWKYSHNRKHHYSRHGNPKWGYSHRRHSGYRPYWNRSHHVIERHYRHNSYRAPHRVERTVVITRHHSTHALPMIAGTLIGSSIANNVSHGDPVATLGGAVFGALIGNALAHH